MTAALLTVSIAVALAPHAPHIKYLKQLTALPGRKTSMSAMIAMEKARPVALAYFANLGPAAKPYLRTICDRMVSAPVLGTPAVLEAVEKIDPKLYTPLREFALAKSAADVEAGAAALAKLGREALPAAGVVAARVRPFATPVPTEEAARKFVATMKAIDATGACDVKEVRSELWGVAEREKESHEVFRTACAIRAVHWAGTDRVRRVEALPVLLLGLRFTDPEYACVFIQLSADYREQAAQILPVLRKLKLAGDPKIRKAATEAAAELEKK